MSPFIPQQQQIEFLRAIVSKKAKKKKNLIKYMELPMERKSLTEKLHYISRVKKATSQRVGLLQRNNTRD